MNHVPARATGRIETGDEAQTLEALAKEEIDDETWNLAHSLVQVGLNDKKTLEVLEQNVLRSYKMIPNVLHKKLYNLADLFNESGSPALRQLTRDEKNYMSAKLADLGTRQQWIDELVLAINLNMREQGIDMRASQLSD